MPDTPAASPPVQTSSKPQTVEERLTALELAVASLGAPQVQANNHDGLEGFLKFFSRHSHKIKPPAS